MVVALTAGLLLAGCSGGVGGAAASDPTGATQTPVGMPDAYRSGICRASEDMGAMLTPLQALAKDASAGSMGALDADIANAKSVTTKVQADLDQVPAWPPGDPLVRNMSSSMLLFQTGFNSFSTALSTNNAQGFQKALTDIKDGTDQMTRSTANLSLMRETYSFTC